MNTRLLTLATILSSLGACGLIGKAPVQGFELRPAPHVQAARALNMELIIERPESSGALNTDGVMMRPSHIEAAYLPNAQWTAEAPAMLQTLLVRAFQQTGGYSYVGRKPLGLGGDFAVLSELIDLQGELVETPEGAIVQARVALRISIVRESDARIVGTKLFATTTPATDDSATAIALALDAAMQNLLPDLTKWVLTTTGPGIAR